MNWTKPPAGATVDTTHPYASGLAHAWLFNEQAGTVVTDCVRGVRGHFRNGTPQWSSRWPGGAIAFNGSSDIGNFDGAVFNRASDNGPFTVVAGVMQTGSQTGFQTIWGAGNQGLYLNGGITQYYNDAAYTVYPVLTVGVPYITTFATYGPDPVALAEAYYMTNGVKIPIDQNTADYVILPAGLTIGGHGSEYFIGEIAFLFIYATYVPPSLMIQIHNDPYAAFIETDADRYSLIAAWSVPPPPPPSGMAALWLAP